MAVKVSPDTRDFKRDAERQLDRIEQQLDRVKVSTKIDMSGVSGEFIEAVRKINKRNRQLDSRKIRFYTTISTAGMATAVRSAVRELQQRANRERIDFKVDDLKATGKIELELDQQSADLAKRKLKDWADDVSPLKVKVEPDIANGSGAALSTRLQILTRPRTVPILPELDNAAVAKVGAALAALSGARVLNSMFEKLGNTLRNLDKSVPAIGSLSLAIAGLAGWGLSAASNLAALSSSLAQIGYAGLLLPGLFGGMAVGLGVTFAALKDFNKVVPEVKEALSKLQDSISKNFWDKAAQPIREMVDELLPEFTAGVNRTATQLGGFFGGLATSLKGALNPALNQMFVDLSKSIEIATTGTDAFANIIATLGKVGTSYLPSLAQWFVQISEKFDAFLQKKGDNGLKKEIDQGIQSLKDLGSILYNTGGILAGVARAAEAAGGSSLGTLSDALEQIHRTVDSEGFQTGLTNVFIAAHTAMNTIATQSGPAVKKLFTELGQLLTDVLPQAGEIIGTALDAVASALAQPAVAEGVKAMFDGIQTAVAALAPAMAPLGKALGALMQLVGAFAAMLGPLIAAALVPLAAAFTSLAPSITPVIQLLGGALTQAIQAIAPVLSQLVPVVGQALSGAFQALSGILPVIGQLFAQIFTALGPLVTTLVSALAPILPVLSAALQPVLTALQPIIQVALQIVTAVIQPLLPMLSEVIQSVLPPLADAIQRLLEAIQPVLDALLAVVNFLMPVLAPAIQFIVELLANTLVDAVNGVALVFEGLVEIVTGVWDTIVGVLKMAWGLIEALFTGNFSTLRKGWSQFWSGLWNFVKGIWDTILGDFKTFLSVGLLGAAGRGLKAIGTAFKSGWQAVKGFGESAWSAIKSGFSNFGSVLAGLGRSMMSKVGELFSAGWRAVTRIAGDAMRALGRAISTGITEAIKFVKELPGKAKSALSNLGSTLVGAGKALIRGLISGIKSMFGGVKSTLGNLTSKFKDWKGPLPKDRVLLYDAGRVIIKGLIKGLESEYGNVKRSLTDLTAKIPKNASKGLKNRINRDRTHLLTLAAQWDAGSKRLEAARNKLDRLRDQAKDYASRVVDRIIDTGDVTKAKDSSFGGIVADLTAAVDQAKRFAKALAVLKAKGLSQTAIDQIASAGPDAGLAAAESIAAAGKGGIDQINALQAELAKYAKQAGKTASDAMYANGIHVAEGIVRGLEARQKVIEAQMLKIADAMVGAIKKSLGIHSPSRVFAQLGSFVGQGFAKGIEGESGRVAKAVDAIAARPGATDYASAARSVSAAVSGGLSATGSGGTTKVLNYYAAAGSSLSSQEELFAAAHRARMAGW
ncbi:phage tail protein [Streptomyces huasconensis]|uniref:phage tail protein n=1 Tax=Streptomyces huasconensis TaxID=1854574 RepID=UPI0033FBCA07